MKRVVNGPILVDLERQHGLPAGTPPRPESIAIYEVREGKIERLVSAPLDRLHPHLLNLAGAGGSKSFHEL
jgi:hypothetical protein